MEYLYEVIDKEEGLPVKVIIHSVNHFEMHWHGNYEFLMVLDGSVAVRVGKKDFLLKEDDFILINPNEMHSTSMTEESNKLIALQIDPDFYHGVIKTRAITVSSVNYKNGNDKLYDKIRSHIAEIVWEMVKKGLEYKANIASILFQIASLFIQNLNDQTVDIDQERAGGEDLSRLQRIINYVNENYNKKLTLAEIAEVEHISYFYLSRFIREKIGISFQQYLNGVRLEKAVQWLFGSDLSIAAIAEKVGFPSPTAFNKLFKEEYRLSPSEYRKAYEKRYIEAYLGRNADYSNVGCVEPESCINSEASEEGISKRSRTYLDVDRHAALKSLFRHLPQKEIHIAPPNQVEKSSIWADAATTGTALVPYWRKLMTFTHASEGLQAQWQQQLAGVQEELGFEHVRFHGIFSDDMMVYVPDMMGNVSYNWSYANRLLDALVKMKLKPFVELGFMPHEMARSEETVFWWKAYVAQPKEMSQWIELVKAFIKHCINRYGMEEVESWYFEVWNEPESINYYWIGKKEEYFHFYKETAMAIKSISDKIRVGGPSISHQAIQESKWLDDFLSYCQNEKAPLDYVSIHIYAEQYPKELEPRKLMSLFLSASPEDKQRMFESYKTIYNGRNHTYETIQAVRGKILDIIKKPLEVHVTEWNASASSRNLIHDTAYVSAFIIKNIIQCIGTVDSIGYWTFTDINEENPIGTSAFHGSFGLINKDGIKKASYYAYFLLSKLGDEILSKGEEYIITRKNGSIQILVCNYAYFDSLFITGDTSALSEKERYLIYELKPDKEIQVTVTGLEGHYRVVSYRLNRSNGSSFDQWVKMGSPEDMSPEEIRYLNEVSRPEMTIKTVDLEGEYKETLYVPVHGAELILFSKIY